MMILLKSENKLNNSNIPSIACQVHKTLNKKEKALKCLAMLTARMQ
jgi:hypothetical protein